MAEQYEGMAALDFDGTLYSHTTGFSDKNRKALHELERRKICRAVITGRNLSSFMNATANMELPIDYLVFSSGAGVLEWSSGKLLKKSYLSPGEVAMITDILLREKLDFMIQKEIPDNHHFHYHRETEGNRDFEARMMLYEDGARPLTERHENLKASQFIVIFPPGRMISTMMKNALCCFSIVRTTSPIDYRSTWIEIFPGDVHKGTGAEWLQNYLGITGKPNMAVGNDYNDVDMLRWTDSPWVVSAAPEELKKEFNITASCEDDGVCEAIAKWINQIDRGNI